MPLLTLKHTANAVPTVTYPEIFSKLHNLLASTLDNGKIAACKSWTEEMRNTYVGDGSHSDVPVVILMLSFFGGRPLEQRKKVSEEALAYLKSVYPDPATKILVEVREIERETCFAV